MVVADLHVHTQNSDGALPLSDLPAVAREAGLSAVAVTDHDRTHPDLRAPVVERGGVTVVHGIELRVEPADGERVDLLAYGVEPTADLDALVERVQRRRVERGRQIVESVESRLGVDLDVDVEWGIGRPDVARAVDAHPDVAHGYEGAFEDLIGEGGPCYVRRWVPSFREGRRMLADAAAVVGLAHPLRYDDPAAALELTADLDAVELHYTYGHDVDRTPVERAVADHDLLVTGGSDAHEHDLGTAGLDAGEYERFRAAL
ncbi:MAG: PHP domain-containing protein [Halobacteriales archaeon]